jgi:diaminopimelate decarboxylase
VTRQIYGWPAEGSDLIAADTTVAKLVEQYGTPLYLYSGDLMRERAATLHAAFPEFEILYSLKSNPSPSVCRLLSELGFEAGVSSEREIDLAHASGYAPNGMGFVGPAKSYSALQRAIEVGVGMIYVESVTELHRVESLAREYGKRLSVAVRVNTRRRPSSAGELMAGGPSQFGVDEEAVDAVFTAVDRRWIEVCGIHAFVASQVMDAESLLLHFETVAKLATDLAARYQFSLQVVNFGGGFGIPYSRAERQLDIERLGRRIGTHLPPAWRRSFDKPRLCLEVGRYLVGEAGLFLTRVVDVKRSRGTTFVVTESGISGFARPAMEWAQQHPCTLLGKASRRKTEPCTIVGPSCMPGDILCENVELPVPIEGDIVVLHNAGAYGLTMSMLGWGSFAPPKEILCDGAACELSETQVTVNDVTRDVTPPRNLTLVSSASLEVINA